MDKYAGGEVGGARLRLGEGPPKMVSCDISSVCLSTMWRKSPFVDKKNLSGHFAHALEASTFGVITVLFNFPPFIKLFLLTDPDPMLYLYRLFGKIYRPTWAKLAFSTLIKN